MAEVYRAKDTRLDRIVALKVLTAGLASDPTFRARFDREARAISQLQHPHICTLHDVGEANGTAYLVMELLHGQTLAERLKKGALPLDDALRIAVDVADALAAAHKQGIVHRDLEPGNIMLTKAGTGSAGAPHAKLLDFGLAKAATPAVRIGRAETTAAAEQETRRFEWHAAWRPDGGELYFMSPANDLMMALTPMRGGARVGAPARLFSIPGLGATNTQRQQIAASAKGDRFLFNLLAPEPKPTTLTVILNWSPEAKSSTE